MIGRRWKAWKSRRLDSDEGFTGSRFLLRCLLFFAFDDSKASEG
jgi:hypothetical protein